jgi:hypothetical protein
MTAIAPTIGPIDLFWIFIMVTSLQPVMKQRWIEASRRRLIAQIERKRGSRVILLAHRQETMSFLGFPLLRYIDVNDSEAVIRAIHLTDPSVPIDLILHTPGGLVLAATQIARAINRRKGKVTAIVPHYAMSGGTLIALAADEIIMSDHAVLGPVDPQLGQYPAASLLKAVEQKSKDRILDETLILADEAKKAIVQVQETGVASGQVLGFGHRQSRRHPVGGQVDARFSDHVRLRQGAGTACRLGYATPGSGTDGALSPARPAFHHGRIPAGKTRG